MPALTPERFGAALAACRQARGLSQAALGKQLASAARSGAKVAQATISSWESGVTVPSAEQIIALERVLCVDDLLTYLGRRDPTGGQLSVAALIAHDPALPEARRPGVLAMYLAACKSR